MTGIRVLIVDDQELIRMGFRMVLDADAAIDVVGEAGDGVAAIEAVADLRPDVVVMDVRMPLMDGIAATDQIVRRFPQTKILVLTTFDIDEYAFGALQAGASGFLLKDAPRDELVGAIRAIHGGDAVVSPRITRSLIDAYTSRTPRLDADGTTGSADVASAAAATELTEREREVFLAIGQGLTNAEIAQALFLGESTVKTHVGRVLAKLQARDRVHLVILAHRWGLVGAP